MESYAHVIVASIRVTRAWRTAGYLCKQLGYRLSWRSDQGCSRVYRYSVAADPRNDCTIHRHALHGNHPVARVRKAVPADVSRIQATIRRSEGSYTAGHDACSCFRSVQVSRECEAHLADLPLFSEILPPRHGFARSYRLEAES